MKIFLSSTSIDLTKYRESAKDALERIGGQVSRMEVFGARPEGATQATINDLKASELFVGIYAYRYGYIPTNSKVSITEQEYDKAKELNKPMFCFIVDPNQPWPLTMVEDEPGKSKLRDFMAKISTEHVRQHFTTPEDLAMKVATALGSYITRGLAHEFAPKEKALPRNNIAQDDLKYSLSKNLVQDDLKQIGYPKTFDVVVRKSVRNLTVEELERLRKAYQLMMSIRDNRSYRHIAGIHGIPDCKGKYGDTGLFLPWNRAYLYWFEQYLKDNSYNSSVSVPWWDWISNLSRSEGIPKAFSESIVDGNRNPLYSSIVVFHDDVIVEGFVDLTKCRKSKKYETRRYPGTPSSLPTAQEVENILDLTDYYDFSDQLEDCSNRVHLWVGGNCGDMSYIPFAAYDPIFWSHRAMIDKIFWLWQSRPGNSLPRDISNEVLDPFTLTVRNVLDIRQLGYDYGSQQLEVYS